MAGLSGSRRPASARSRTVPFVRDKLLINIEKTAHQPLDDRARFATMQRRPALAGDDQSKEEVMKRVSGILGVGALLMSALAWAAVNVNSASAEEMAAALNGVGEAIAERIVAEREANGAFKDAEDLQERVKGIGPTLVDKNEEALRF